MNVLVIDLGGTNVKLLASGRQRAKKFPSGKALTPKKLVAGVLAHAKPWKWDAIALGYPGRVGPDGPAAEPGNLGTGWVGFDFTAAFDKPVRVVNDAAMQALGGYAGGRMLFLGFGTGLGSALVADRLVMPLELGELGRHNGDPLGERLGKSGLKKHGPEAWNRTVTAVVAELKQALAVDEVLLGGGNAELVDPVPPGCRVGGNQDAFAGGFRLWEQAADPHHTPASPAWRVIG